MTEPSATTQATGAMKLFGIPAAGLAALPACPACYPAYMAVLSALGLGGLSSVGAQTFLTLGLVVVALAALAFRARARRGYGPLLLGVAASGLLLAGKLWLWMNAMTYTGVAVLVVAAVWNVWPRRDTPDACAPYAGEDSVSAGSPAHAATGP